MMSNYGKRDYKIAFINKEFHSWIRSHPTYGKFSLNKATKRLKDDLVTGRYTDSEMKQRLNKIIKPIEEMVYGRKKR